MEQTQTQAGNRKRLASSSLEKDNKKAKDALCSCSKPATEDILECIWCEGFQHRECTKISADVRNALSSVIDNIVFFCSSCLQLLPVALKYYNTQSNVDSNVARIESSLLEIQKSEKNLCDLFKQFDVHDHHESVGSMLTDHIRV